MNRNESLEALWQQRIANFKASGLTQKTWCSENSISYNRLKYWMYKHKPKSKNDHSELTTWIPVSVLPETDAKHTNRIVVKIGVASIEIHSGFDQNLFIEVLDAVKKSC